MTNRSLRIINKGMNDPYYQPSETAHLMFQINERFKQAMDDRLKTTPVNARLLLITAGVGYEEVTLPDGVLSVLRKTEKNNFSIVP